MDIGALNQAIGGLAVRTANITLLAKVLNEQRAAGAAMLQLIEGGAPARSTPTRAAPADAPPPPAPPPKGAAEPGKGENLDVVA